MARSLKPHVMETFNDKVSGDSVDLMLDRNRKIFYAEYQLERFENAEAAKVEVWIRKQLAEAFQIVWQPVLKVQVKHDDVHEIKSRGVTDCYDRRSLLDLYVDRFYVGVTKIGKIKTSEWRDAYTMWPELTADQARTRSMSHCSTKYEIEDGKIALPWMDTYMDSGFTDRYNVHAIHLPYSESMWIGLRQIQEDLRGLSDRLQIIIGSTDGLKMIDDVGQKLIAARLPAGDEKAIELPEPSGLVERKIEHVNFRLDPDFLADMGIVLEKDHGAKDAVDGELVEQK